MIPFLLFGMTDQVPVDLSMRWSTAGEYRRPWDTSLLRDQCRKVESDEVSSSRAI